MSDRVLVRWLVRAACCAAAWLLPPPPATAQVPRNEVLSVPTVVQSGARNLATFLRAYKQAEVALDLRVPPVMTGAGSNALRQQLVEALAAQKIQPRARARFTAAVGCSLALDDGRLSMRLTLRVEDALGRVVLDDLAGGTFENEAELLALLGVTARLTKSGLAQQLDTSGVVVAGGSKAQAARDSKYAVEVRVADQPRKLSKREADTFCLARLDAGEEYAIRLTNEATTEVLARVRIDGLSVFHFSELRAEDEQRKGEPRYRFFIVPPRGAVVVRSWHKKNSGAAPRFKVTPPDESAAGKLGKADEVGVITVEFLACRKDEASMKHVRVDVQRTYLAPVLAEVEDRLGRKHRVEKLVARSERMQKMAVQVGTGFGTEVVGEFKDAKRWIGPVEEVVSIHYGRAR